MTATAPGLTAQRCRNHPQREAAALCTSCKRLFCRECVADHRGRMVCADCLEKDLAASKPGRRARGWVGKVMRQVIALTIAATAAWFYFYAVGRLLRALPTSIAEFGSMEAGTDTNTDSDSDETTDAVGRP